MLVAAAFGLLWLWRRRRAAGVAAVAWGAYGVYELLMQARVLCTGECNIRVDLLLIYPLLLVLSLVAIAKAMRAPADRGD
ncbi:MAG: hypothetical protein AB7T31_17755 [Gemmatimonadales bacterium]